MQKLGVIQKVSEPTPWCAAIVVVPKKSGDIRICVDLQPLNENVLREIHPIFQGLMIYWPNLLEPRSLANLMPIVGFGRFLCQKNLSCLQLLLHPSVGFVLISSHLVFLVLLKYIKNK